jgi:hypothetical protein
MNKYATIWKELFRAGKLGGDLSIYTFPAISALLGITKSRFPQVKRATILDKLAEAEYKLVFYKNRSTPQVLRSDRGEKPRPKAGYGEIVSQRKASPEEVKKIEKGEWLRVDAQGHTPDSPLYKITEYRKGLGEKRKASLRKKGIFGFEEKTASMGSFLPAPQSLTPYSNVPTPSIMFPPNEQEQEDNEFMPFLPAPQSLTPYSNVPTPSIMFPPNEQEQEDNEFMPSLPAPSLLGGEVAPSFLSLDGVSRTSAPSVLNQQNQNPKTYNSVYIPRPTPISPPKPERSRISGTELAKMTPRERSQYGWDQAQRETDYRNELFRIRDEEEARNRYEAKRRAETEKRLASGETVALIGTDGGQFGTMSRSNNLAASEENRRLLDKHNFIQGYGFASPEDEAAYNRERERLSNPTYTPTTTQPQPPAPSVLNQQPPPAPAPRPTTPPPPRPTTPPAPAPRPTTPPAPAPRPTTPPAPSPSVLNQQPPPAPAPRPTTPPQPTNIARPSLNTTPTNRNRNTGIRRKR